jgi:cbb3-type cytochrome oxidase maturation protein
MNTILIIELFFGLMLSFVILGFMLWGAKTGQFDDSEKQKGGLLFDSEKDLNDAIKREKKIKQKDLKD